MRRCPSGEPDWICADAAVVFATNPGEMRPSELGVESPDLDRKPQPAMPACANVSLSHHLRAGDHVFVAVQPAGTVTFVFTDIEGSTELLDNFGAEAFKEALVTSPTCKLDPRGPDAPALTEHPSEHAYWS